MTLAVPTTLTDWLVSAAGAAADSLAVGEPLTPAEPSAAVADPNLPVAVLVRVGGAIAGEIAMMRSLIVDSARSMVMNSLVISALKYPSSTWP